MPIKTNKYKEEKSESFERVNLDEISQSLRRRPEFDPPTKKKYFIKNQQGKIIKRFWSFLDRDQAISWRDNTLHKQKAAPPVSKRDFKNEMDI